LEELEQGFIVRSPNNLKHRALVLEKKSMLLVYYTNIAIKLCFSYGRHLFLQREVLVV